MRAKHQHHVCEASAHIVRGNKTFAKKVRRKRYCLYNKRENANKTYLHENPLLNTHNQHSTFL